MTNKRFEWDAQTACFADCFSRPTARRWAKNAAMILIEYVS
jgi:hypothetical protein